MKAEDQLYRVKNDAQCLKCGCRGAVQFYGNFYPEGIGERADNGGPLSKKALEKYRDSEHMSHAMGFGGTIPWECLNCGNTGLIDSGGLEGYQQAFRTMA